MKHGILFGEHIKTERIKRRRYDDDPPSSYFYPREWFLPLVIVIVGLLLLCKLISLQLFQGDKYRTLADSNRIRTQVIPAQRGVIFDRHGEPLVFNMPGFRRVTKDKDGKLKVEPITKEEALQLIAKGDQSVSVASLRQYPFKDAMSHVLGYIGQISEEEFKSPEFAGYLANDWVGKSGIEAAYEHTLKGTDGKQLIEVDAVGKQIRPLGRTDPIPGQDIRLTIDAKLQKAVYSAMSGVNKGVVIVSKPDGELLAMVSKPSFDPNLFTLDKTYTVSSTSAYATLSDVLLDSRNQPLLNRAIGGIYPPGSTFKLITAAAGLEDKIIDEKYRVEDTGVLKVGEFSYANWYYTDYGKTDGSVDVIKGIARSNDIFFYKLAEKINVDRLSAFAKKFGLGSSLGIDLGGEVAGLLPNKEWKKKALKESWYLGDTFHYGIGQGYLLTTPLQVNLWTAVIANGGSLLQPHLLQSEKRQAKSEKFLSERTISLIRRGMIDSCSKGGVAYPLFEFKVPASALASARRGKIQIDGKNFMDGGASGSAKMTKVSVACKTGTAQHGGEKTLPHAWITLFAPAYKPEIVVTVLVEAGGGGSDVAAPIAKKVLEAYFGKN